MNGIYLLFLLLIYNVSFSLAASVAKRQAATTFPPIADLFMNNEPSGNEDLSTRIEKLMNLLRRHQRDEEDLKCHIKQLLSNFHTPGIHDSSHEVSEHSAYRPRHKSVKDVLRMLNLSSNQNDLLEKIIMMMQGRRGNRKTSVGRKPEGYQERQLILDNQDADSKAFQKVKVPCLMESNSNRGYEDPNKLSHKQIKEIAKEVVKYLSTFHDVSAPFPGKPFATFEETE